MHQHKKSEDSKGNPAPAPKILIVDDKMENCYLLESMFGANGYMTESASNGIEALGHLKTQHFDAIISDLLMPKMDGFQLIRECKKDPSLNKIPFIIYTATYTETKDMEFGLSLGAVRYIIKPAEPEVLLLQLNEALGQSTEGALEEPVRTIEYNENFNREYAQRLVKKLDKKILALQESEEQYRLLADSITDIFFAMDHDLRYTYWNKASEELTGIPAQDAIGKSIFEIFSDTPEIRRAVEVYQDVIRTQKPQSFVNEYHHEKEHFFFEISAYPSAGSIAVLTKDITDRKRAEDSLKESEERYRNVVEDQTEYICRFLPDGTHVFVNDAYCRYFGKKQEELLGHRFKVVIHPEDREQVTRLFFSLSPQQPQVWIVQRIIMPEGSIRWQRWSDRAIFDKNGRIIEYQSVGRDITEQKQAEEELQKLTRELEQRVKDRTEALVHLNEEMLAEIDQRKDVERQLQLSVSEKETLLKEIHHRVKNNLQIIASLLNLQSQYIKDEQTLSVIKDSQNRIKTMALIHEKIYQSKSLDRIDYGDYLEKITRSLFESYGVSPKKVAMKIHAKNVMLHIDKAIPCSLIINELLANSFKHAFPKDRTGEVRIDVRHDGDTIRLLYSDNGIGLPESITLDHTGSLGMRLISGLTQQLKGTVEIQRGGGTTFLIAFNV